MWPPPSNLPILSTKLIPPSTRIELVDRQRLTSPIEQATSRRLCLISAPAGYGKTSILAQAFALLAGHDQRVGWVSLERDDNDLARFLTYVIEAGGRARLHFGNATLTLLRAGVGLPAETLKTSLLNELSALEREFFLFLDDYHLIEDRDIRDFVNTLLLAPIPHVHLLVATRSPNELPIGRLRALAQVHELEADDLVFSESEIAAFFSRVARSPLEDSDVALLRERTEGWIASLQMVSIAMSNVANVPEFLRSFSGEHRSISQFLSDEVFRRQSEDIQEFLLGTSVLKRFNCGLCNAVLRRNDSRGLLDRLEADNLFVFSLGPDRNWYRYHHLFSEYLRKVLAERNPDLLTQYHRRACTWLASNEFMTEAIDHAFSASDFDKAAELLDGASASLFATGQTSTLQSYSARIRSDLLDNLPRLQLELAWDYEIQWRFDLARRVLSNVRRVLGERQIAGEHASTQRETEYLRDKLAHRELMLAMFSDDYDLGLEMCRRWQHSNTSDDLFMQASVGTSMMMCNRERYVCEGTAEEAETLRKLFVDGAAVYGTIFHDTAAGETFFMSGEIDLAEQTYRRALLSAEHLHGASSKLASMPAMMLAELLYEQGSLKQAESLLERYHRTPAEFGFVDNAIARFVTGARLARHRGDAPAADAVIDAGMHIAHKHHFRRLLAHLLAERVHYLIDDGKAKEAAKLIQTGEFREWCQPISPNSKASTTSELFSTIFARVAAETGPTNESLTLIRRWFNHTRERRCSRSAVRLGVLLAKLYSRAGDDAAARRYLMEALKAGEHGRFIQSFVDEGPVILQLLRDLLHKSARGDSYLRPYAQSIAAGFENGRQVAEVLDEAPGGVNQGQLESLSAREIEIVTLAGENLENKEIADTLGLTENTIKWHWKRIFSKLHVHRRFHAVKVARKAGFVA